MDEPTSSIDSHTEHILQSSLNKISEGRTTIIIYHRLSTIVNSDKILLLKNGEVLEEGNHNDLLKLNGEYHKMYNNQLSKKKFINTILFNVNLLNFILICIFKNIMKKILHFTEFFL